MPDADSVALMVDRLLAGDRLALGRAISLVENSPREAAAILERLHPKIGRAHRIGFTGPPGVGKSTLVAALAKLLRAEGHTVGIVAVDPTSPFTGGALLGDRIRMSEITADPGVFVRSMATRGSLGGLARAAFLAADLLDAFGKAWILIETVGVGQSEIDVTQAADLTVVVLSPESGDTIQTMKSGLLETASCLFINKADRPGAEMLAEDLRLSMHLSLRAANPPPVLCGQARDGVGVGDLQATLNSLYAAMTTDSGLEERRRTSLRAKLLTLLRSQLIEICLDTPAARARIDAYVAETLAAKTSPYTRLEALMGELLAATRQIRTD